MFGRLPYAPRAAAKAFVGLDVAVLYGAAVEIDAPRVTAEVGERRGRPVPTRLSRKLRWPIGTTRTGTTLGRACLAGIFAPTLIDTHALAAHPTGPVLLRRRTTPDQAPKLRDRRQTPVIVASERQALTIRLRLLPSHFPARRRHLPRQTRRRVLPCVDGWQGYRLRLRVFAAIRKRQAEAKAHHSTRHDYKGPSHHSLLFHKPVPDSVFKSPGTDVVCIMDIPPAPCRQDSFPVSVSLAKCQNRMAGSPSLGRAAGNSPGPPAFAAEASAVPMQKVGRVQRRRNQC